MAAYYFFTGFRRSSIAGGHMATYINFVLNLKKEYLY